MLFSLKMEIIIYIYPFLYLNMTLIYFLTFFCLILVVDRP